MPRMRLHAIELKPPGFVGRSNPLNQPFVRIRSPATHPAIVPSTMTRSIASIS